MPLQLTDHQMDWAKVENQLWGSITPTDPMYRSAIAAIRRCKTMSGAMGASRRLHRYFIFLADRGVAPIDASRDDIEDFVAAFGPDHAATAECHLAHVKGMYSEATYRGVIAQSPAVRISIGRYTGLEVPALTLEQAQVILEGVRAALDQPAKRLVAARDLALLTILISVGPRSSELRAVSWSDVQIDAEPPTLMLYGKGRAHRTIRLPAVAVAALRLYRVVLAEHDIVVGPGDAITMPMASADLVALRDPRNRPIAPMSNPALRNIVRLHLVGAGVNGPRLGPHRLRATAATLAHLAEADVVAIAAMLGHRRVDTTIRGYIRPANALAASPADRVDLLDIPAVGESER